MNMAYQKIKVVKYKCFQDTQQKMLDIVKRATSRKPESITNNITWNINTMTYIRKTVKSIGNCSKNTKVLLPGETNWEDGNYNNKISEINTRKVSYSEGQGLIFINNNNIDGKYRNRVRLHLNKKGYSKLSLNLNKSMKSIWLDVMHTVRLIEISSNISSWQST